ncbi:hypothetical protein B6U74_01430 [Candidatus Bathyarchaeota archaeon ex4484_205]|nr:MAG: hypothetical protein B6U74_01430 [Candidatus Bathyarchaeota archaeon ex4484_205]
MVGIKLPIPLRRKKLRDMMVEELRREMRLSITRPTYGEDWDSILYWADETPLTYSMCRKPAIKLKMLKEVLELLKGKNFDSVKRTLGRKSGERKLRKRHSIFYDIVFRKGDLHIGYGSLIQLRPEKEKPLLECGGYIFTVKMVVDSEGKEIVDFECGRFRNYKKEIKPLLDKIGSLYHKI